MPGSSYRFGPFLVDRTRYQVVRDGAALEELTPKLLDLLLHLLDHAGALVTKEELLDALWPDANVTDNALAQAVSELRQALGDDAGTPQFIKTIARRGYRFIGPVSPVATVAPVEAFASAAATPSASPSPGSASSNEHAIAVMDFANVTGESDSAWLSMGIAETVTGDLRALGRFRVVDRGRVMEAMRRTNGSLQAVSADLGVPLAVVGSYQRNGDQIRINGRIVNVKNGEALADAKIDGPLSNIFELQDCVVAHFSKELGIATTAVTRRAGSRETSSLEAYRAFTEGWLHLEALDVRHIPQAIASFEHATAVDPRYAPAFTGLASAQMAAYETTRSDNAPRHEVLDAAIGHARRAVLLDDSLAEAHATLALTLVSAWETTEALQSARRAVALEPTNWRHFFRLGHAAWGEERVRAAAHSLALYPDFAFAYFQAAMVHVARGDLAVAETVLRQGAAVQDRQIARGERYPALGLHWLLGLVRLAQNDADEALREFEREGQLAEPHRLYGREYQMHSLYARGACLLRSTRYADAIDAFQRALAIYPDHPQTHLGLALALRETGSDAASTTLFARLSALLDGLRETRPIEAAIVQSQVLVSEGRPADASAVLGKLLEDVPAGFAAWTLPIEPFLNQLVHHQHFAHVLGRLGERAR